MGQDIQSLFLTSLTAPQLRDLFRAEIENYFNHNPVIKMQSNSVEDTILDIDQAAEYIKLSIPSIYRLCSASEMPVIKKGKKLLFSKNALTQWLMQGRKKTLSEIQKDADRMEPVK